jgi:hypothetical protein
LGLAHDLSPRVYEYAGTKFMLYHEDGLERSKFGYSVVEDG